MKTNHKLTVISDTNCRITTILILKLKDRIRLELCKFVYKYKNGLLPVSVKNLLTCGSEIHCYNTRNRNVPTVNRHYSTIFNNIFLCKGNVEWTKLNKWIKNLKNIKLFVHNFKMSLLQDLLKWNEKH